MARRWNSARLSQTPWAMRRAGRGFGGVGAACPAAQGLGQIELVPGGAFGHWLLLDWFGGAAAAWFAVFDVADGHGG
jgi:hypothetical protein